MDLTVITRVLNTAELYMDERIKAPAHDEIIRAIDRTVNQGENDKSDRLVLTQHNLFELFNVLKITIPDIEVHKKFYERLLYFLDYESDGRYLSFKKSRRLQLLRDNLSEINGDNNI